MINLLEGNLSFKRVYFALRIIPSLVSFESDLFLLEYELVPINPPLGLPSEIVQVWLIVERTLTQVNLTRSLFPRR